MTTNAPHPCAVNGMRPFQPDILWSMPVAIDKRGPHEYE